MRKYRLRNQSRARGLCGLALLAVSSLSYADVNSDLNNYFNKLGFESNARHLIVRNFR